MRINESSLQVIHRLRFLNAARGGGVVSEFLEFSTAIVNSLPAGLDALVLTSDLQGVVPSWRNGGANVLLGVAVAEELAELADAQKIPDLANAGVVLAGDLYSAPGGDKRGATGDVREVWEAFSELNRWVVGVPGNHDLYGSSRERERLENLDNVSMLDGSLCVRDDLTIGGVGYVIGNPAKTGRREEGEFLAGLDLVLEKAPDVLVLHEGPHGARDQRGNVFIRSAIESAYGRSGECLVVCGHTHWNTPLADLRSGQVVNVDCRVLILLSE